VTSLESTIPERARLVLDSSVVIAYLNANEVASPVARIVIDEFLARERNNAVLSASAAGEILVRPYQMGKAREVAFEILDMPGVQLRSVDFLVAAEAARMRSESKLRLPDAIVLATGVLTGAAVLVTNDRELAAAAPTVAPGMAICLLSDHVAATGPAGST
jgi:predicted nucleic acid-binding protein